MVRNDLDGSGQLSGTLEAAEANEDGLKFADCPRESCGEIILLTELENHLSLHDIEDKEDEDNESQDPNRSKRGRTADSEPEVSFNTRLAPALRNLGGHGHLNLSSSPDRQVSAKVRWRERLNMSGSWHERRASPEPKKSHRRLGVSFIICFSLIIH